MNCTLVASQALALACTGARTQTRDKDEPNFRALGDTTVVRLVVSGELEHPYKKWFQSAVAPNGVNRNAPMSKPLIDNLRPRSDRPAT